MGLIQEFKDFAMRGNVVDMAVGVVIGTAFGKIIAAMVEKIIMPVVGMITGGVDFSKYDIQISPAVTEQVTTDGVTETVEKAPAVMLGVGSFVTEIINFIIIAFAIFMAIKLMNSAKARFEKAKEEAPPAPPAEDIVLLREIRDALKR
ncbi:MAG: large conductance mechanosensitive channel protein MscL [Pirellulaceae bacterium]